MLALGDEDEWKFLLKQSNFKMAVYLEAFTDFDTLGESS